MTAISAWIVTYALDIVAVIVITLTFALGVELWADRARQRRAHMVYARRIKAAHARRAAEMEQVR